MVNYPKIINTQPKLLANWKYRNLLSSRSWSCWKTTFAAALVRLPFEFELQGNVIILQSWFPFSTVRLKCLFLGFLSPLFLSFCYPLSFLTLLTLFCHHRIEVCRKYQLQMLQKRRSARSTPPGRTWWDNRGKHLPRWPSLSQRYIMWWWQWSMP